MKNELNIALVQPDIIWEDIEANIQNYNKILLDIKKADLIIFPEMFVTGFSMNQKLFNKDTNHRITEWLKNKCSELSCAIIASSGYFEKNRFYNRCLLCSREGVLNYYNKRHLFSPGKENEYYDKGNNRVLFEIKKWKILPQVCYDLRFPVWSRNDMDYDLIINVANWPAQRNDHWKTLLKARAIENQVYVIGVNRTGVDNNNICSIGNSLVYRYDGSLIINMEEQSNKLSIVTLNKEELNQYRKQFPFLDDRDDFEIL